MSRHIFGRSLTDWTMDLGDTTTDGGITTAPVIATGPATLTLWSAAIGGVQYTDLISAAGVPVTTITASDGSDGLAVGTIPEFQGPDNVFILWADAGAGARYKMTATDLGDVVADLMSTLADQQATIALLSNSPGYVLYNTDTASWPDRPVDSRPYFWIGGPGAPSEIPSRDLWINTQPS